MPLNLLSFIIPSRTYNPHNRKVLGETEEAEGVKEVEKISEEAEQND